LYTLSPHPPTLAELIMSPFSHHRERKTSVSMGVEGIPGEFYFLHCLLYFSLL
jgi:hypothetical protein